MKANYFQNPFAVNRAEHMGEDLYRYFAGRSLFAGKLSRKSLVVEGGRGSGKTMYFMYNSYDSKKREHYDPTSGQSLILQKEQILGIYFKAEPDLVTGFQRKEKEDDWWSMIFGHYFNVTICRSMCHIGSDILKSGLSSFRDESEICSTVCQNISGVQQYTTLKELKRGLEALEDEILLFINNIGKVSEPIFSHHSHGMKRLAEKIISSIREKELAFHVFVDEFENLLEYQQEYINSLIKNPSQFLVFDVGIRLKGFKTHNTLASGEQISPWNDYNAFNLEEEIDAKNYDNLITEICSKRLMAVPELTECSVTDKKLQIDFYLGNYDMKKELELIISPKSPPPYVKEIDSELHKVDDKHQRETYEALTGNPDPIINRLNLVLLLQKKSPQRIAEELQKYMSGKTSKYKDWLHNYSLAVLFLLCRDYRQRKRYFGYDAFLQLSSGIPRYFIQLCYYAFDYAYQNDEFTFGKEASLSIGSQDRAAYHLSNNKVDEIDTYPPIGYKLKRLTLVLGRIFEQLHKRPNISEPEPNHFYTDYDSLSSSAKEVIDSGVTWAVFQPRPLTKIKSPGQHRGTEYHLNHIYAPYFQISYRRKRRLDIKARDFSELVDGDENRVARAAKKLIGPVGISRLADLLQWEDMQPCQMDMWSHDEDQ